MGLGEGRRPAPALALQVFGSAVNNGPGQTIRWLQRAAPVKEDGQLGPITLAAIGLTPGIAAPFHAFRVYETTKLSNWLHNSRGWAIRLYALPFQAQELTAYMD